MLELVVEGSPVGALLHGLGGGWLLLLRERGQLLQLLRGKRSGGGRADAHLLLLREGGRLEQELGQLAKVSAPSCAI